MEFLPYRYPRVRSPTQKLGPIGYCIYCSVTGSEVQLTDEHIVPDGLGGDLVLAQASCKSCAAKTSRAERRLQKDVMQFARNVVRVSSRKRKKPEPFVSVEFESSNDGDETKVAFNDDTPFIFPFITTDELPGILRNANGDHVPKLRISLFGPPNWNEQGQKWLKGNGKFKWGTRFHAGIVGQALAKIAHSYACATIGPGAFEPLLNEYILAKEPPFDGHHIGIYPSDGFDKALHYIDLQVANAPHKTVLGLSYRAVYVVTYGCSRSNHRLAFWLRLEHRKGSLTQQSR